MPIYCIGYTTHNSLDNTKYKKTKTLRAQFTNYNETIELLKTTKNSQERRLLFTDRLSPGETTWELGNEQNIANITNLFQQKFGSFSSYNINKEKFLLV